MVKSIFISVYSTIVILAAAYAVYRLFAGGISLAWVGALVACSAAGGRLIGYFIVSTPRTSRHMGLTTGAITLGALLALTAFFSGGDGQILSVLAGFYALAGWLAYVYWYSVYDRRDDGLLAVGRQLPEFQLEDQNGTEVNSRSLTGKATIFIFYRGNWCPLCMAQIKEVAAMYQSLAQRGVQVILISPQSQKHTRQLAERFEVPFIFFSDPGNKAAAQLKLVHKSGVPMGMQLLGYDSDTVMPTVVITDPDGNIVFADLTDNYRVRPEPEFFLSVLDAQGIAANV